MTKSCILNKLEIRDPELDLEMYLFFPPSFLIDLIAAPMEQLALFNNFYFFLPHQSGRVLNLMYLNIKPVQCLQLFLIQAYKHNLKPLCFQELCLVLYVYNTRDNAL